MEEPATDEVARETSYARRLTRFDATMVVIGGIIGAGIFLNPAIVAQRVGSSTMVLVVWGIGGAIALLGALCFSELGSRQPEAGGGYVYLREAFGPLLAFLYGWTSLLVINTGAIAAVAVTFAYYAGDLLQLGDAFVKPLAVGAIVLLTWINYLGVRPGSITQNIFTVLKLVAVFSLVVAGLVLLGGSDPDEAARSAEPSSSLLTMIGAALIPVLFAYGGWQHANHVAGEVANPQRNLPWALVVGVAVVVVSYLLANWTYVRALGMEGLAASDAPASDAMQALLGPTGSTLIGIGIVISTFGFVNLVILAAPRVYQAMAEDGVFFERVARLHPRYQTPAAALLLQGAWAIALTLSGTYAQLLDYVVFGDWILFGLVAATLFYYRRQDGGREVNEGFRMPGYPALPALFILAAVFLVVSSVLSNPLNSLLGGLLIAGGVPVYYFWKRKSGGRRSTR